MRSRLEKFFDLSFPVKIFCCLLVIGLALLPCWFFWYIPLSTELERLKSRIDGQHGLKKQVAKLQSVAGNLSGFKSEVEDLDLRLKKAINELPEKQQVDVLLASVADKARGIGLHVGSVEIGKGEILHQSYAEKILELEIKGRYHDIASFFDEVGNMDRIINLTSFNIQENSSKFEKGVLHAKVTASAFRVLDQTEIARLEAQKN